jgi:hypothetical protein
MLVAKDMHRVIDRVPESIHGVELRLRDGRCHSPASKVSKPEGAGALAQAALLAVDHHEATMSHAHGKR